MFLRQPHFIAWDNGDLKNVYAIGAALVMSDFILPEQLMSNIWLRLAIKSTVRFRCVSKSWCTSLSDPEFIYRNLTSFDDAENEKDLLMVLDRESKLYSVVSQETLVPTPLEVSPLPEVPSIDEWQTEVVTYSCDDLVCFHKENGEVIGVWNLTTGETKILPRVSFFQFVTLGFGFDEKIQDYKIVLIGHYRDYDEVTYHGVDDDDDDDYQGVDDDDDYQGVDDDDDYQGVDDDDDYQGVDDDDDYQGVDDDDDYQGVDDDDVAHLVDGGDLVDGGGDLVDGGADPVDGGAHAVDVEYRYPVPAAYVYSLRSGNNCWRKLDEPYVPDLRYVDYYCRSYRDGKFYWCDADDAIVYFDMSREVFNKISIRPLPHPIEHIERICKLKDGSMLITSCTYGSRGYVEYELWALLEVGVSSSLTRLLSIDWDRGKGLTSLGLWRNELVVQCYNRHDRLLIGDPFSKQEPKEVEIDETFSDLKLNCFAWRKGKNSGSLN